MALENLGLRIVHKFSCDSDPHVQTVAAANFAPEHYFKDITQWNNKEHDLRVDVYVAGFPCQPFSGKGNGKGTEDDRGRIVHHVIRYINDWTPKVFILENVPGLVTQHKKAFDTILKCLGIAGKRAYNITWQIINASDHGIPQHRPRVYIIGIRKDVDQGTFKWPDVARAVPLATLLDPSQSVATLKDKPPARQSTAQRNWAQAIKAIMAKKIHPFRTDCVINVDSSKAWRACLTDRL